MCPPPYQTIFSRYPPLHIWRSGRPEKDFTSLTSPKMFCTLTNASREHIFYRPVIVHTYGATKIHMSEAFVSGGTKMRVGIRAAIRPLGSWSGKDTFVKDGSRQLHLRNHARYSISNANQKPNSLAQILEGGLVARPGRISILTNQTKVYRNCNPELLLLRFKVGGQFCCRSTMFYCGFCFCLQQEPQLNQQAT